MEKHTMFLYPINTLQSVHHLNKGSIKMCLLFVFSKKSTWHISCVLFHLSNCAQSIYFSCLDVTAPPYTSSPSKPVHPQLICQFTFISLSCESAHLLPVPHRHSPHVVLAPYLSYGLTLSFLLITTI